ncbi:hypothetical protein XAB3213_2870035 [Xanthomonas citri pv. bilvae]|nr:hypothetical protein XAB3213_2870035 [Xanthomonas citri pv. bilvae]
MATAGQVAGIMPCACQRRAAVRSGRLIGLPFTPKTPCEKVARAPRRPSVRHEHYHRPPLIPACASAQSACMAPSCLTSRIVLRSCPAMARSPMAADRCSQTRPHSCP